MRIQGYIFKNTRKAHKNVCIFCPIIFQSKFSCILKKIFGFLLHIFVKNILHGLTTSQGISKKLISICFFSLLYFFLRKHNYIIMDLLGPNLKNLFKMHDNKFSHCTIARIAIQVKKYFFSLCEFFVQF